MKEEQDIHAKLKLRQRAEEVLQGQPDGIPDLSEADMQRLIHELCVHQIELEIQNEELRRSQLEIEASRTRYSDLYDFAPVGYFTMSAKNIILHANLTIATMFGVERGSLIGKPFSPFIHKDDQDTFYSHRRKLIDTNNKQTYELRLVKQDGSPFHVQMECLPVLDEQGTVDQVRAAVTDITARKQAEDVRREYAERLEELVQQRTAELQESETRYRAVSELTSDYAYAYRLERTMKFERRNLVARAFRLPPAWTT